MRGARVFRYCGNRAVGTTLWWAAQRRKHPAQRDPSLPALQLWKPVSKEDGAKLRTTSAMDDPHAGAEARDHHPNERERVAAGKGEKRGKKDTMLRWTELVTDRSDVLVDGTRVAGNRENWAIAYSFLAAKKRFGRPCSGRNPRKGPWMAQAVKNDPPLRGILWSGLLLSHGK